MNPERSLQTSTDLPKTDGNLALQPVPVRHSATLLQFPVAPRQSALPKLRRLGMALEFSLLFIALPLLVFFHWIWRLEPLHLLWIASGICLFLLLRDPSFDGRQLWNVRPLRSQLPSILGLFTVGVVAISALVCVYAPGDLFHLVRNRPGLWALVMLSYPPLSVLSQAIVYRAFILHRYRKLAPRGSRAHSVFLILLSAGAFSFSHIVFHNWIAVALTFPGGILFALRYLNTRSQLTASLEHTLYGWFLFTIGLSQYFGVHVH